MEKKEETLTFLLGRIPVDVNIRRKKRRSIQLSVHPDQKIILDVPVRTSKHEILQLLEEKKLWLVQKLQHFSLRPKPVEYQFVEAEEHFFLGSKIPIQLTGSGGHKSTVGQTIQLNLNSHATPKQVETALNHWYGNQARRLLPNRVKLVRETLKEQHFPSSELKFRKMKRRWGSCSKAKKSILLNTELIKAPVECIDYVIVHELCHLKIANHSKDFYALLGVCLPNWKKWKDELENGNYLS